MSTGYEPGCVSFEHHNPVIIMRNDRLSLAILVKSQRGSGFDIHYAHLLWLVTIHHVQRLMLRLKDSLSSHMR